jgi:hypothetical protein
MGDQGQTSASGGPLEDALQGNAEQEGTGGTARAGNQAAPSGNAGIFESGAEGASGGIAQSGRAGFTTPGAVSSIRDMAARTESYSDPIAGEAEAGAEMLERAKKQM